MFNLGKAVGYLLLDDTGFKSSVKSALGDLETLRRDSATTADKFTAVGSALNKVGGTLTKNVSLPLAGIGVAAVKVTKDFDTAMSQVQATMGITKDAMVEVEGQTVNAYSALRQAAKDMGSVTKFSATEAAEALNYLALAGYDTEKQIAALPTVLNLAAAGSMDLAYASDLVTDSMSVLGLEVQDLESYSDKMAKTASSANTSVSQLGEAVLVAGGQASLCGMDVTELNTALGILADNGIKGSEGGTMLRNTLKNLYTPTDNSAKALKRLGIETVNADGSLRKVPDVLKDLAGSLDQLTAGERVAAMAEIFDTRTIAGAQALLKGVGVDISSDLVPALQSLGIEFDMSSAKAYKFEDLPQVFQECGDSSKFMQEVMSAYNLSAEDAQAVTDLVSVSLQDNSARWDELAAKIDDSAGACQQMADTQLDNLEGKLTILKSGLEGAGISIGEVLVPKLIDLVAGFQGLVDKFNEMDPKQQEFITNLGLIATVAGPVLLVLGHLSKSIANIINTTQLLTSAVKKSNGDGTSPYCSSVVEACSNYGNEHSPRGI